MVYALGLLKIWGICSVIEAPSCLERRFTFSLKKAYGFPMPFSVES
jgi:hypothetical protein